ncbi:MAG: hydantoinase/oxoprolinase family protein [Pseudomonadota bacterium]
MSENKEKYIIGIDTGGTFTDTVIIDKHGKITIGKALTNYGDLKAGVISSLRDGASEMGKKLEDILPNTVYVGHGTTLGTNAVINRTFGKVGLLTTAGHEDISIIMRAGAKTDGLSEDEVKHQATCRKPEPLVPRPLIKGIVERMDCFGKAVIPLDLKQAKQAIDELAAEGCEAIAICLLWSFTNAEHEIALKKLVEENYPDIYLAVSHEISPKLREYARTMTVIIDACIGKLTREYIDSLNKELKNSGLKQDISIMHAYGGVTSWETARPVSTIESGPVGGVVGSKFLGNVLGEKNIITTDVGGTSFDVSVLADGEWSFKKEPIMMRFRVTIPIINITCIGAAGGTISRIDPVTGGLKVGPDSAGSTPGPVCYERGGEEPTVTDVDVVLGYLNPGYFFGGKLTINKDKAYKAIKEKIADPLCMDVVQAAAGIYDIINSFMADNLRQSVIDKGHDPRDFVLLSYGGNGPMHCASFAKDLGAKKVIIPPQSSVFSAFGIACSDVIHVYTQTDVNIMPADPMHLNTVFEEMEKHAIADMALEGIAAADVELHRELDLRYNRQVHEVNIPAPTKKLNAEDVRQIMNDWEARYEQIYGKGSGFREAGMQVVTFRLNAVSKLLKPSLEKASYEPIADSSPAVKGTRPAFFRKFNDYAETNIYDSRKLKYGNKIEGPAIIETPSTTMVILPDQKAEVDAYMNVVIVKL